ncbi:hypothetical protein UIS43_05160 [Nocardiopsis sp. LDBS0036]|uniref:hypothetical protein n=1 Tax=Nocardiopsis sp. LDBS0036 TaxID=3104276 RepID=UPI0035148117
MGTRALPPTLRHRGFGLLLAGRGSGELGSAMLPVAVVGLVLAGHGPLLLGLVLGARCGMPAWLLLTGYAVTGTGFMLLGVYWHTALQRAIPQDLLSVVISVDEVGSFALEPAGYALAGALAQTVGPRPVLVGAAVAGLVTTLVPLAVPGVSRLADPDRPAAAL